MSLIKSIKQVLGLSGTAAENHFWDGSVANQLTLKRGTPDAPGATVLQAVNGVVKEPNNALIFDAFATSQLMGWGVDSSFSGWIVNTNTGGKFSINTVSGLVTPQVPGIYLVTFGVSFINSGITNNDASVSAQLLNQLSQRIAITGTAVDVSAGTQYPSLLGSAIVNMTGSNGVYVIGRKTAAPNALDVAATLSMTLIQAT